MENGGNGVPSGRITRSLRMGCEAENAAHVEEFGRDMVTANLSKNTITNYPQIANQLGLGTVGGLRAHTVRWLHTIHT